MDKALDFAEYVSSTGQRSSHSYTVDASGRISESDPFELHVFDAMLMVKQSIPPR